LFPIAWREPFGLVMIEAMACGTPVIAFENGSVPEVLEDGVTGFIVQNENQAVEAVRKIDMLDRDRIRAEFDRRFTAQHMAQNYLKLYARLAREKRTRARLYVPLVQTHHHGDSGEAGSGDNGRNGAAKIALEQPAAISSRNADAVIQS
jgi:hypothetical protein